MADEQIWDAFDVECSRVRGLLKLNAAQVKFLKSHPAIATKALAGSISDQGEMVANIMLAYRHLEDAAMRLGRAIQAFDGGKSVYDK